jgi:hypothetical protein
MLYVRPAESPAVSTAILVPMAPLLAKLATQPLPAGDAAVRDEPATNPPIYRTMLTAPDPVGQRSTLVTKVQRETTDDN